MDEKEKMSQGSPVLTPGGKAVGLDFNPSGDVRVTDVKGKFAGIFDIVEGCVPADDGTVETARKRKMRDAAIAAILTAQMWAVKVITMKN